MRPSKQRAILYPRANSYAPACAYSHSGQSAPHTGPAGDKTPITPDCHAGPRSASPWVAVPSSLPSHPPPSRGPRGRPHLRPRRFGSDWEDPAKPRGHPRLRGPQQTHLKPALSCLKTKPEKLPGAGKARPRSSIERR